MTKNTNSTTYKH